jgi:DNA-binding transcriptional MerR regulator
MKSNLAVSAVLPESDVVWIDAGTSPPPTDAEILSIGEMAEKFGMTQRALRFYESRGLLNPTRDRGTRLYGREDQRHLALILKGRRLGFTLSEIAEMIGAKSGRASPQALKLTRQKCLEQIAMLEHQTRDALEALAELRRIHGSLCRP